MKPTIGRIVLYVLSTQDAEEINRRRTNPENIKNRIAENMWPIGAQAHIGARAEQGEVFPAQVVKVNDDESVSLKVNLDGTDTYWATNRIHSDDKDQGTWHWMEYQKQQAVKEYTGPLTGEGSDVANGVIDHSGTALGVASGVAANKPYSPPTDGDRYGMARDESEPMQSETNPSEESEKAKDESPSDKVEDYI